MVTASLGAFRSDGSWQPPDLSPARSASISFLMQRDPGNEFLLKAESRLSERDVQNKQWGRILLKKASNTDKLSPWECPTKNTFSQCRTQINRGKQIISSGSRHNDTQVEAGVGRLILARGHPGGDNEGAETAAPNGREGCLGFPGS